MAKSFAVIGWYSEKECPFLHVGKDMREVGKILLEDKEVGFCRGFFFLDDNGVDFDGFLEDKHGVWKVKQGTFLDEINFYRELDGHGSFKHHIHAQEKSNAWLGRFFGVSAAQPEGPCCFLLIEVSRPSF